MAFLFVTALVLLILYILLIGYYQQGFRQLKSYEATSHLSKTKITIIIPARNEALHITNCLNAIALQTYPSHLIQIIVVDDFSTDSTATLVSDFKKMQIELLSLKSFITENDTNSYKKKGIEIAVKHATGELIICTDADCIAKEEWVSSIVSFYEKTNAQFIAAPVKLAYSNGSSILEKKGSLSVREDWGVRIFQTIDFATLQGITAASVFKQFHTMCNGANLAYTKKAYEAVNGFEGIDALPTGDDMLLMYKIFKKFPNQVHYLKSKNAIVTTATVNTWKAFFNQRIRWASKATYYDDKKILYTLLLVYAINVWSLLLVLSLFFNSQNIVWVILFLKTKSIVEFWFLQPVLSFFEQLYLRKWFIVCIPFHILYTIIAGWLGKFGKYEWKGRRIG